MFSIYQLKPGFQKLLRPIVYKMAKRGITANQVTIGAIVLSFAAGVTVSLFPNHSQLLILVPLILFVRMAFNAIDEMLAREHNMKTPLGAVLNEMGDVVSDAAIYFPFALIPGFNPVIIVIIVILAIISEMVGVLAVSIGASRRYDGPMGKNDRAFVFGTISLLIVFGVPVGIWVDGICILIALLLLITVVNRAGKAVREVGQ